MLQILIIALVVAVVTLFYIAVESQRLQQQTLTSELLIKQWVEKWDGKLPTTVTGDSMILSIPKL